MTCNTATGERPMAEPFVYHDGSLELIGELHRPGTPNGKAMLVVHEADGIGGNVQRRCAMLTELGYLAFAADMHGGGKVLSSGEIAPAMDMFLNDRALLRRRVTAAYDALRAVAGLPGNAVAAFGYCFGGATVLELARSGAALAGVVSFHGLLTAPVPAPPGQITARVLACTGARDPLVPPEDVAAFQAEMTAAEADWQLLIYGRAMHSFTNPAVDSLGDPRMAYDRVSDEASWHAAMLFLEQCFAG